jgi:tetratricopeptide (TPR) repeat protein
MGRLDHPNIGRILEAGTTAEGQPFFAMELIEGPPITHYCRDKRLPLEDRLRLFLEVCRGAHHAHLKLLLHRDLKPSNVLVTEIDGRPVPKIIDFGVAKGLDGALLGESLATGDRLIGTPAYMSPEALEGGELDVRSDIFSLGVLLHELLTGVRPWDTPALTPVSLLKKRLEEQDAPRPSTRVPRGDGEPVMVEEPAELARRLRGDLDWIVLRALARDPAERYGSAAELAADLERTLRDEPINARPPTATYLLRKLVRRHRTAFFAALVALLAVLLGAFGTSLGLLRARRAEAVAQEEARRAVRARDAEREISEFLLRIFRATGFESDADPRPPSERTALELLDHAAARLSTELGDHPLTKARLEGTIGTVYRELGLYETSHQHLRRALELFAADPRAPPLEVARIHLQLAATTFDLNDTDATLRHVNQGLEALGEPGDRESQLLVVRLLGQRGHAERRRSDSGASERSLERALEILRSVPDPPPMDLAQALSDLAFTHFTRQRWAEAETLFRQALDILRREMAPGHPRRAKAADNLGAAIASQGRLEEAIPLFEQALEERRRMLGDDHPDLGISLNNLGMVHLDSGRPERAERYHREALELRRRAFGPEHPTTAWSLDNLARTLDELGRIDEARDFQAQALAVRERALGPGHPTVPRSRAHLARLALAAGEPALARTLAERALEERIRALGPEHPQVGLDTVHLARALWRLGDRDEARLTATRGLAQIKAAGEDGVEELRLAREVLEQEGLPAG